MDPMVTASTRSSQFHSLEERRTGADRRRMARMGTDTVVQADVVEVFFAALAANGIPEKAASITMGIDASTLSKIKHGRGTHKLPLDAVFRMPDEFLRDFLPRVERARGIDRTTPTERQSLLSALASLAKLAEKVA